MEKCKILRWADLHTSNLKIDHIVTLAIVVDNSLSKLRLICREHNQFPTKISLDLKLSSKGFWVRSGFFKLTSEISTDFYPSVRNPATIAKRQVLRKFNLL